jgi:hypothetical protein
MFFYNEDNAEVSLEQPVEQIVTDGLQLHLDAGDTNSYPGTGTTWYDLSGNGYDFNITNTAFQNSGNINFMNFEGPYGSSKRVVNGSLADLPIFEDSTIMIFSTILNSTAIWRTLVRGASADHQVIISTSNKLGMFDNDGVAFIDSGFDITSLPNPYTQFNFMCWRFSQSSPYYQFQFNENPNIYSIINSDAFFNNGFCVIGAYHNYSTSLIDSSQYWGKVALVMYYNRALSQEEIQQNFNTLRNRFGL